MEMQPDGQGGGAGARVGRLVQNVAALGRLRLEAARRDLGAAARGMAIGVAFGAVALVLVLLALPILITVLILVLALFLPPWAAAAVVLGVMIVAAAVCFALARRRLRWPRLALGREVKSDWEAIRAGLEARR